MTFQVSQTQWLELPRGMREQLVKLFNIPKHGHSVVHGGKILADGYTNQDLQAITIEKINSYLGTSYEEIDILKAFNQLVEKLIQPNGTESNTGTAEVNSGTGESTSSATGTTGKDESGIKENPGNSGETTPSKPVQASNKVDRGGKDERTSS